MTTLPPNYTLSFIDYHGPHAHLSLTKPSLTHFLRKKNSIMATLHFISSSPSVTLPKRNLPINNFPFSFQLRPTSPTSSRRPLLVWSYKVVIEHEGQTTQLDVEQDETILAKALDSGLSVPHDCKLGVCMTCPAQLISGSVDQSDGMLSDDVVERGFALLCASYPRSDCHIKTIPEEELLSIQLATAND